MEDHNTESPTGGQGRRKEDRRQSKEPFEGADRRKGDRRTGDDRRRTPRN